MEKCHTGTVSVVTLNSRRKRTMIKTPDLKIKQAQCEIDAALAKRNRARKLWDEAEEELVMARIKMTEAEREAAKIRKLKNL